MGIVRKTITNLLGLEKERQQGYPKEFLDMYQICKPYTMTSMERMFALYQATHNILDNRLEGDLVECGVWKGGSSLMMALILKSRNISDKTLFLYDTYEGMSAPTADDVEYSGKPASDLLAQAKIEVQESVWCYSSIDEVKQNLLLSGLPASQVVFVKGKVEDTITEKNHKKIALLRLDTDWYESTKHEMVFLYPALVSKGVLIIDDYGHWQGSQKAVDEYFANEDYKPLLNRIDYTGRLAIKP